MSDYEGNIEKLISKQTRINHIWSSLTGIPRNPSISETTVNDTNNTQPTLAAFDLDGHTTPNSPKTYSSNRRSIIY